MAAVAKLGGGRRAPWRGVVAIVAAAALGAGCVSGTGGGGGGAGTAPPAGVVAAAGAPWDLPSGALPSQRLYQGGYEGPEGGGSFRATLRLAAPERFRLDASDRLGRPLWSVGVDDEEAWWIDHRAGVWCPDLSKLALPGLGRGPVPPAALPTMLLGALPARPAGEAPATSSGSIEVVDGAGRHWQATVAGGQVVSWSVAEGGQPLWWWRRQGRGGILSQRNGRQLRWQEVVVEPLRGALPPRTIPADYREACDELPER